MKYMHMAMKVQTVPVGLVKRARSTKRPCTRSLSCAQDKVTKEEAEREAAEAVLANNLELRAL